MDMSEFRQYAAHMNTALKMQPPPPLDSAAVAQRLRMYMGDVKLTRSKLALASGINRTSLADRLDGHVDFTLEDINAIARAIGGTWLWVLSGEGDPPSGPPDYGGQVSEKKRTPPQQTDIPSSGSVGYLGRRYHPSAGLVAVA